MSEEALYNKIDKFCNKTDWSKYPTYEHALEEFIKEIVEEETKELEKENAELKKELKKEGEIISCNTSCYDNRLKLQDQLVKAKEIIKTFLGFAATFGYSPSMDKFISDTEQFLNSEVEK